jgi:hypothetical protein
MSTNPFSEEQLTDEGRIERQMIIKSAHTPGPWQWVAITDGWDGVTQENGPMICKLVLNEPENARLIAAAPELLEALRLAYRELNDIHARCGVPWWETGKSDVTQEHFTFVVEKSRAAITKATGK